jgi:hypothetical protein
MARSEWVYDELLTFLGNPLFQVPVLTFMEANCISMYLFSPRFLCRLTALIKLLVAAVERLQATLSMPLNDRGISD